MSAGKNRQSHQSYRLRLPATVISAVAGADVRCAGRRWLGGRFFIGAAPGCPATRGCGGATEQGVGTR